MIGYQCHYKCVINGKIVDIRKVNNACWKYVELLLTNKDFDGFIYVLPYCYVQPSTKQYIPLIIDVLSQITPCEIVEFDNEECIRIKMLHSYDSSLILLNFLRNLWNPCKLNYMEKEPIYNIKFFEVLETSTLYTDPLERLTHPNKMACTAANFQAGLGHSNTQPGNKLVVKNTASLLNYKGRSTREFLTTE